MIHEEICTYEVCKLAEKKGFGEMGSCYQGYRKDGTLFYFSNMPDGKERVMQTDCLAPTQSLLQRWLREEKDYYVYPSFDNVQLKWDWVCREKAGDKWIPLVGYNFPLFDTYELALEDALKYALENLI